MESRNLLVSSDFFLSFFFFFFFLQSFQLKNGKSDFDQTWSQEPLGDWLQKLWGEKNLRGQMGSQGSKKVKSKNRFNSSALQAIIVKFGDMKRLDNLYKSYGVRKNYGVKWGHRDQI